MNEGYLLSIFKASPALGVVDDFLRAFRFFVKRGLGEGFFCLALMGGTPLAELKMMN